MTSHLLTGLILALGMEILSGLVGLDCQNTVIKSVLSNDNRFQAVLFERSCDATTGFTTQVSILNPDQIPSGAGNVFVADLAKRNSRPTIWGGPFADVEWTDENSLLVAYDENARVFKMETRQGDVIVSYRTLKR